MDDTEVPLEFFHSRDDVMGELISATNSPRDAIGAGHCSFFFFLHGDKISGESDVVFFFFLAIPCLRQCKKHGKICGGITDSSRHPPPEAGSILVWNPGAVCWPETSRFRGRNLPKRPLARVVGRIVWRSEAHVWGFALLDPASQSLGQLTFPLPATRAGEGGSGRSLALRVLPGLASGGV